MALTATATLPTRKYIITNLCMQRPFVMYVSPVKTNITYYVRNQPKGGIPAAFKPICTELIRNKKMDRTLIFCRSYNNVIRIHQYFKLSLRRRRRWLEPPNSPDYVKYRVVDMFTHSTHPSVKEKIIEQFTSDSPLRVIIATVAFGSGMNCPDIRRVIHWGVPQDAEAYVQESGRAGRDGKRAIAEIMTRPRDLSKRFTTEQMLEYCKEKSACRQSILYRDFPDSGASAVTPQCKCCDVCKFSCKCENCQSTMAT